MANTLSDLTISEISLVDAPANAETDPVTGIKVARARVALYKRDDSEDEEFAKAVDGKTQQGTKFPASDFAYVPDKETPSTWKLRLTKTPGGAPDAGIVGAAVAALGKGFRGNKVQIPASALPAVKARVRSAWYSANPGKGSAELPDVLKIEKGETQMTVEQIEKQLTDQDAVITTLKAESDVTKAERDFSKAETDAVLAMTDRERVHYAKMSAEQRTDFIKADVTKRKAKMEDAEEAEKNNGLVACMDEPTKKAYADAGPKQRTVLLEKQEKIELKKAKKKPFDDSAEDGEPEPDEDDMNEDTKKMFNKAATVVAAQGDQITKTDEKITKLETELTTLRKRDRRVSFSKRAETELPNMTGTDVEKGEFLMSLADSLPGGENGESFKKAMTHLKAADTALTLHYKEIGKAGAAVPAEAEFMAKVQEISKRDNISEPKAIEKAMFENPALYIQFEQQHRRAIAGA